MPAYRRSGIPLILCLVLSLSACNFPAGPTPFPTSGAIQPPAGNPTLSVPANQPTATESLPGGAQSTPPLAITATSPGELVPGATTQPQPGVPNLPEEAILIQEPGAGSRLVSPIRVAGITDPTFEQTIGIRIVLPDGSELATSSGITTAGAGQRGPFEAQVEFQVTQEMNASLQIFAASPRDGNVIHLSSVGVTLAPSGAANIIPAPDHPEQIAILQPAAGNTISGGVAHVSGYGTASFEQHLLVQVQDTTGQVIGSQPVLVQSPNMGQPGPFEVNVPYTLTNAGPGRISVHDPSPAFGGDIHVTSVEVQLQP